MKAATLALSLVTLAPCATATPAPGEIKGTVTLKVCGGPTTHCSDPRPVSWTFAVARPVGSGGDVELVGYVTSDAEGHFDAVFGPGVFTLVPKYTITHDPADYEGGVVFPTIDPFEVAPFGVVTKDVELTGLAP